MANIRYKKDFKVQVEETDKKANQKKDIDYDKLPKQVEVDCYKQH